MKMRCAFLLLCVAVGTPVLLYLVVAMLYLVLATLCLVVATDQLLRTLDAFRKPPCPAAKTAPLW